MVLIKCACGCFFTVEKVEKPMVCQNCSAIVDLIHSDNPLEPLALPGSYACEIADNAKLSIVFESSEEVTT